MIKIEFDEHGFIKPYKVIELTLSKFGEIFIKNMPETAHRERIFQRLLEYNLLVEKQIGKIQFQYLNGSFTTLKNKPKDIDVVSFISYTDFLRNEELISTISEAHFDDPDLDVFIVPLSFSGAPLFIQADLLHRYYLDLFSNYRKADNKVYPKGLIKINYYEK